MKTLYLINAQRQSVGHIEWRPPQEVTIHIEDPALKEEIAALVERAVREGLPLRGGTQVEKDGRKVFVEQITRVKADSEQFLGALADAINRMKFRGERIFGSLKPM